MKLDRKLILYILLLLAAVFLFVGEAMPSGNEFIYLLRLVKQYNPAYLANDFSLSFPGNEHWLFNHIFGLPAQILSIETLGWLGRIACWIALLLGLFRLGSNWEISLRAIAISIFVWLCLGQSIVAEEWMIGGFEAKCIAYICLIFALDGFCRGKEIYPAILTGLTFSFHPAVGMWGGLGIGIALLLSKTGFVKLIKAAALIFVFALPGILPLVFSESTISNSLEEWKFIVLVRTGSIFNPFIWSKASMLILILMFVFCLWIFIKREQERKFNFLKYFLIGLGLFFLFGVFLRATGQYELMRLMPMRLFPVFVPLFFFFTFARTWKVRSFSAATAALVIAISFISFFKHNPAVFAYLQIKDNYETWVAANDDAATAFMWVADNAPEGVTVISPPWRRDSWYHSERPQIASYGFPVFESLPEWRNRISKLIGGKPMETWPHDSDEMADLYRNLKTSEIDALAREYGANYIVTDADYEEYPVLFVKGKWKVFQLRGK